MVEENIELSSGDFEVKDDFIETDDFDGGAVRESVTDEEKLHKRTIKNNAIVLGSSVVINAFPIVIDAIKHKKENKPYSVDKSKLLRLGISSIVPCVELIDTVALKGKISKKVPLTDIRNITNIVCAYPSTHRVLNTWIDNNNRNSNGTQQMKVPTAVKSEMIMSGINIIIPYAVNKFTDDNLSFTQKLNSIVPLSTVGLFVRRICGNSKNPKLAQAWNVANSTLTLAKQGTNLIGGSVRSSPNSNLNKTNTAVGNIIDTVSEAIGGNRNGIGGFSGGGYNRWDRDHSGSSWY